MTAAEKLALWVKEHAGLLDASPETYREGMDLASEVLAAPLPATSLLDRAYAAWVTLIQSSGEVHCDDRARDFVRAVRAMEAEAAAATPRVSQNTGGGAKVQPPAYATHEENAW